MDVILIDNEISLVVADDESAITLSPQETNVTISNENSIILTEPQETSVVVQEENPIVEVNDNRGEKGLPGYTPIKGIDYFDGEQGPKGDDGYTPIKGVDYFDGEKGDDGYTPIKGVDYFDGQDGLPGLPGQDGYTPIKGVDYFDGQDGLPGLPGQDGYTPIKGVDYFDGYTPIKGVDYFDGEPGPGVASGGTAGQVLSKIDSVDYNTQWITPSSVVGPASSVNDGIAIFDGTTGKLLKDERIKLRDTFDTTPTIYHKNIILSAGSIYTKASSSGSYNVIIGDSNCYDTSTNKNFGDTIIIGNMNARYFGSDNAEIIIGYENNKTLYSHNAFPEKDMANITIGVQNNAKITHTYRNVTIGSLCNPELTTGYCNTSIGVGSGAALRTTSYENTCVGYYAGNVADQNIVNRCTFIGTQTASVVSATTSGSTALGYNAQIKKSNQMVLGGTNIVETLLRGQVIAPKIMLTQEGGYAIKITNRTGETSVKGKVVSTSPDYDNAVRLCPVDSPAPVGVIYEDGIANGSEMWVVVSGIAEVLFVNNVERNWLGRVCRSDDSSYEDGKGWGEVLPTAPFATDKHFQEFSHILETKTAGNLTKVILHYN